MAKFSAKLDIIVGNPFVFIPPTILHQLFDQAGKDKGPIPVCGSVNGKEYQQTLVKYSGEWRLYVNMKMLKDSPRRIGEMISVEMNFDAADRTIKPHPILTMALAASPEANQVFAHLSPSKQKEIVRYISNLKSEESVKRNVKRAINFLLGNGRFVGRDAP